MVLPAALAALAIWGAVALYHVRERKHGGPVSKILIWLGILALSTIAFGIGSCYAIFFTGNMRIGG